MNTFTFNFNTLTNLLLISLARVTFFFSSRSKKSEIRVSLQHLVSTLHNFELVEKKKNKIQTKES